MNRVIRTILLSVCFTGIFTFSASAASELPFTDVSVADDYYDDLVSLYQKGIVSDNPSHSFSGGSFMRRDEFVSVVVGIGCVKCLSPSFDDIVRYNVLPFVDFERKNPNFYCVSYAKERSIVEGYAIKPGQQYVCQNGKAYSETPFCPDNKISRIEAVAVLLRQAKLWNDTMNGESFERKATFSDVSDRWYGYAQKAVELGMLEPSANGAVKPDEYITKREFVRMAAKAFFANACLLRKTGDATASASTGGGISNRNVGGLSAEILVFDKENTGKNPDARKTSFPNPGETTYDFLAHTSSGTNLSYQWSFTRLQDGKTTQAEGEWLDNHVLDGNGTWYVKLRVTDGANGRSATAVASVEVTFSGGNGAVHGISVTANADKLSAFAPGTIRFSSESHGGSAPYSYRWDFGDGTFSSDANPVHTYQSAGTYGVMLTVRDSGGSTGIASLAISMDGTSDIDGDWVENAKDACPKVRGPASNQGCPVVETYSPGSGSGVSYVLSTNGVGSECLYSTAQNAGAIFGVGACSSCPCQVQVDFNAMLRRCDRVIPAILSTDKIRAFSQGAPFEIRF